MNYKNFQPFDSLRSLRVFFSFSSPRHKMAGQGILVEKNSGFVIIIALITSTIILSIAIGVLSISLKDYIFSGFTVSSTQALFAADTGLDCALAYDIKTPTFNVPTTPRFGNSAIIFANIALYNTLSLPDFGAIGDFNKDGLGDIVIVSSGSNPGAISVYLNAGSGTFPLANRTDYVTGDLNLKYGAVGDLNSDGWADIATVSYDNPGALTLFRNKSNGTFGTTAPDRIDINLPSSGARSVAIGDLNGDNKMDIAVASYTNYVWIYRNTGTGGAGSAISFTPSSSLTTGSRPTSVAIRDLDGDGKVEIAITNRVGNRIEIFRNTGTGGVGSSISFASGFGYSTPANYPESIAIGDLNSDGRADLATAHELTDSVSILRNATSGASTPFTPSSFVFDTSLSVDERPTFIAIGDINDDGKADIATANTDLIGASEPINNVSVFRNNSVGAGSAISFAARTNLAIDNAATPRFVAIGDLNNDSMIDLVTEKRGTQFAVFLNTGAPGGDDECPHGTTPPSTSKDINCAGQTVTATTECGCNFPTPLPASASLPRTCKTTFSIGNSDPAQSCAEIEILSSFNHQNTYTPNDDTETQRIRSRGHNTCDTSNPRRVERALELNYGQ
jgi:hypothetical protein